MHVVVQPARLARARILLSSFGGNPDLVDYIDLGVDFWLFIREWRPVYNKSNIFSTCSLGRICRSVRVRKIIVCALLPSCAALCIDNYRYIEVKEESEGAKRPN